MIGCGSPPVFHKAPMHRHQSVVATTRLETGRIQTKPKVTHFLLLRRQSTPNTHRVPTPFERNDPRFLQHHIIVTVVCRQQKQHHPAADAWSTTSTDTYRQCMHHSRTAATVRLARSLVKTCLEGRGAPGCIGCPVKIDSISNDVINVRG
jgi:hypothetical protein